MSVVVAQRYELLEQVGAGRGGAAATVWLGRDLQLDRPVAVKILPASIAADPAAMERFRTEAGIAVSFDEDGIAPVLDYGVFEDHEAEKPYLVMEYLSGGTLAERLRRSRREAVEVVTIAAGILNGLAAIHRRQLTHGDVRTSNVMFDAQGQVALVDFGMARVLGDPMVGRDDVYGVGALMFEALTGQSRDWGSGSESPGQRPAPGQRDPSYVDPRVPADLGRIVRRALARRPEDRFADAGQMLAELEELDLPAAAPPQPNPGNLAPRQQSRTSLTWTLADLGRRASRHLGARLPTAQPAARGLDPAQIARWTGPWLHAQQVLCQYDAALGYWRIPDRLVVWAPPTEIPPGAELESLIRAVDHVAGRRLLKRLTQSDTAEVRLPRLAILLERVPDGELAAQAWFSGTPAPDRRGDQLLAVEIGAAQRQALEMTVEIRQAGTWTAQSTSVVAEGLTFGTGAWVDVTYVGPGLGRVGPEALKIVGAADGRARAFVGNAAGIRLHDAPTGGLGRLTGGRPVWRREVPHGSTVEITAGDHVYFPEVEERLRLVFE